MPSPRGQPRTTKDLDLFLRPETANAERVLRALRRFGAPTRGVSAADFATPGTIFQIGVAPVRVDLITQIDGVTFEEAWPSRVLVELWGVRTHIASVDVLVRNKSASGRPQDLLDVEALKGIVRPPKPKGKRAPSKK